jgi:putative transposase
VPRRCRSVLPDGIYHVTARGTGGSLLYVDDYDRATFTRLLREVEKLFGLDIMAWCLMGTHFHVIVACSREQLSRAMHRLNGLYAQGFNRRHGRRGHLFEERFSAWLIETEEHLIAAINYVLENPAAADLCRDSCDWIWRWSAFDESGSVSGSAVEGTVPGTLGQGQDGQGAEP